MNCSSRAIGVCRVVLRKTTYTLRWQSSRSTVDQRASCLYMGAILADAHLWRRRQWWWNQQICCLDNGQLIFQWNQAKVWICHEIDPTNRFPFDISGLPAHHDNVRQELLCQATVTESIYSRYNNRGSRIYSIFMISRVSSTRGLQVDAQYFSF